MFHADNDFHISLFTNIFFASSRIALDFPVHRNDSQTMSICEHAEADSGQI